MIFRRRKPPPPLPLFDPTRRLLGLSDQDAWTIADAYEGVQVFGATGSGKTSGSGAALARAFLAEGFGGLVLAAKADECRLWEQYAKDTGREDALLIVSPESGEQFNFLEYERSRPGRGGGLVDNIAELLLTVCKTAGDADGKGGAVDPYWSNAMGQLLRHALTVLVFSDQPLSLARLLSLIRSMPDTADDAHDPEWQEGSLCFQCLEEASSRVSSKQEAGDFAAAVAYLLTELPRLADRTRSSIISTFTSVADGFVRHPMREMFTAKTTFAPELSHQGAVIVLDLPTKLFHNVGRNAQVLFKYLWQRAAEARDASTGRPVFLWADEAQLFLIDHDWEFQTTARASRVATVYLTQNISNYYTAMGSHDPRSRTDSLLGNLQTKVFHANGDAVTNKWAEELIGREWTYRGGVTTSEGDDKQRRTKSSANINPSLDSTVLASEFTKLRKGGPANDRQVDAIVFQGGRLFQDTGKPYARVTFQQKRGAAS